MIFHTLLFFDYYNSSAFVVGAGSIGGAAGDTGAGVGAGVFFAGAVMVMWAGVDAGFASTTVFISYTGLATATGATTCAGVAAGATTCLASSFFGAGAFVTTGGLETTFFAFFFLLLSTCFPVPLVFYIFAPCGGVGI